MNQKAEKYITMLPTTSTVRGQAILYAEMSSLTLVATTMQENVKLPAACMEKDLPDIVGDCDVRVM